MLKHSGVQSERRLGAPLSVLASRNFRTSVDTGKFVLILLQTGRYRGEHRPHKYCILNHAGVQAGTCPKSVLGKIGHEPAQDAHSLCVAHDSCPDQYLIGRRGWWVHVPPRLTYHERRRIHDSFDGHHVRSIFVGCIPWPYGIIHWHIPQNPPLVLDSPLIPASHTY